MVESWQKLQQEQDNAAAGIAELKTGFSQEMDELQAQLAEDVAAMELSEEAAESGRATIQGFVDGASGMLPRVQAAYRRIADAANAALNSAAASTTETGFASGTMSAPPGWAWVGEAGPELMRLRGGETILPADVSQDFAQAQQAIAFAPELAALLAAQQAQNAVSAVEAQPSSAGGVTVSLSPSYQISGSANAEELRAWHEKSGLPLQGGGTLGASCAAYKGDEYNDASGSPVRSSFSLPMFFAFSISDSLT